MDKVRANLTSQNMPRNKEQGPGLEELMDAISPKAIVGGSIAILAAILADPFLDQLAQRGHCQVAARAIEAQLGEERVSAQCVPAVLENSVIRLTVGDESYAEIVYGYGDPSGGATFEAWSQQETGIFVPWMHGGNEHEKFASTEAGKGFETDLIEKTRRLLEGQSALQANNG